MKFTAKSLQGSDAVKIVSSIGENSRKPKAEKDPDPAWTHYFKCDGRTYKLFKRNKSRDGAWEIDLLIKGERIQRSTQTNSAEAAERKAINEWIRPARAGNWEKVNGSKSKDVFSSIGDVLKIYDGVSIGEIDASTARQNKNSFRLVVRRGLNQEGMADDKVDELSTGALTGKLVSGFEEWMKRAAVARKLNLESSKRTVIAYLRHSRSIFKELNLMKYRDAGLRLPDLKDFMTRPTADAARLVRVPVSDKLLQETLAAARELRTSDRPAYVAWLMALCTLRRGEICWMEFSWVQQVRGMWCVVVPKEVAKSGCDRMVPIDARVALELEQWKLIRQVGLNALEEKYVVPSPFVGQGGPTAVRRGQAVMKRVNVWMRGLGWRTNHTLHEMRALALSWLRDDHGLDTAQAVAGHADSKTTERHYVGMKAVKGVVVNLPMQIAGQNPQGGDENLSVDPMSGQRAVNQDGL